MSNFLDYALGGVIILFIIGAVVLGGMVFMKFSSPISIELPNVQLNHVNGQMQDFLVIAERFAANHKYNIDAYNCVNFSNDEKDIMDQLGIEVHIMQGCSEDGKCHEWLVPSIDFEPQDATFKDYSKQYQYNRSLVR